MPVSEELLQTAGKAVAAFFPGRQILGLTELGDGHINDTWLVVIAGTRPSGYVLQRLNRQVFPQPELLMVNLRVLADHLERRLRDDPTEHFAGWEVIRPISAVDGRDYFIDPAGNFWRMLTYVGGAASFERIRDGAQAHEAGRALGLFHRLVSDLAPARLVDTLPGFHVTPRYLAAYDLVLRQPGHRLGSDDEESCARVIEAHRNFAAVLEDAARSGVLPVKVIHGDPKPANIMFAEQNGRVVSMVDLDTVKPGLLHYDIGDCLRSCCNPAGDNGAQLAEVRFDPEICRNLLDGYLAEMAPFLTPADCEFIYPAVRLLAFELGLRFFTDHLAGDGYFKVNYRGHNLQRAMAQFRLLASIEDSGAWLAAVVRKGYRDFRSGS